MAQRKTTRKSAGKTRSSSQSTKKAAPSRKTKTGTRKQAAASEPKSAGDEEVTIDRRRSAGRRSDEGSGGEKPAVAAPKLERRKKVNRRRQIDPTTCERDYTDGEVEFMNALDEYKRKSGRMFPTCSEVLEVVRSLGYVKLSPTDFATFQETGLSESSSAPEKWFASDAESEHAESEEESFESALAD